MNKFERTVLAIVVTVLLAGAWFFRWAVTPINHGDSMGGAYMLNRWTGALYYVRFDEQTEVKLIK